MTEDERHMLKNLVQEVAVLRRKQEEQDAKVRALYAFLMDPRSPGGPSRAQEMDGLLGGFRSAGLGFTAIKWLAGLVTAALVIWGALKGVWRP